MDVQVETVGETKEELLAVRGGFKQALPVQQRRARSEAALRARNPQGAAAEDVLELA